MTIEQTVDIPPNHRLIIEVPREIPPGRTILAFTPAPVIPSEEKRADNAGKRATPISDSLLGIAAGAGDMSLDELRTERLSKYLK
jgi:hypothetical protein